MEKYKVDFIEFMIDCEVLKFGDFITKSKRKTPFFINTGCYCSGSQLSGLGMYYAKAIEADFGTDFDVLFGPAYKGIPLSVATSMKLNDLNGKDVRYCSNRKEIKDHGDTGILFSSSQLALYTTATLVSLGYEVHNFSTRSSIMDILKNMTILA